MARIRTIKPEFFSSEDIVTMTPLARLFYVSLWCESDREGRLDWKPGTFKIRYFAADSCNLDELSRELVDRELIHLYEVDGKKYAEIPTFKEHQVINNRESESLIPARVKVASPRVLAEGRKEGKGKEGKEHMSADKLPTCPAQEIIASYHDALPELPSVKIVSDKRNKAIKDFWKFVLTSHKTDGTVRATDTASALDWINAYFMRVRDNAFLMGKIGRVGEHAGWQCDLDYLLTEKGMTQVIEKTREAA